MRLLLLAVVLVAACSAGGGLAAAAERVASGLPLPGDRAPALPAMEWLQRGRFDTVRPVQGRLLTVIELFATWDPGSRAVLPMHDRLQTQLADQGVHFVLADGVALAGAEVRDVPTARAHRTCARPTARPPSTPVKRTRGGGGWRCCAADRMRAPEARRPDSHRTCSPASWRC